MLSVSRLGTDQRANKCIPWNDSKAALVRRITHSVGGCCGEVDLARPAVSVGVLAYVGPRPIGKYRLGKGIAVVDVGLQVIILLSQRTSDTAETQNERELVPGRDRRSTMHNFHRKRHNA